MARAAVAVAAVLLALAGLCAAGQPNVVLVGLSNRRGSGRQGRSLVARSGCPAAY